MNDRKMMSHAAAAPGRGIRAAIFDADGTLIDSEEPGMEVLYEQAVRIGLTRSREEAFRCFRGSRMADCVAWIAANSPETQPARDEAYWTDFTRHVRERQAERFRQSLLPMPGAEALLAGLRIPFCLATNGPRRKIDLTLALTGLDRFFGERVFSAYESGFFKPDPRLFLLAAEYMGVAPEYCAVVEDSLPGIEAGLAAGMQVFSLHEPAGLPVRLIERVTHIAALDELAAYLT